MELIIKRGSYSETESIDNWKNNVIDVLTDKFKPRFSRLSFYRKNEVFNDDLPF